MTHPCVRRREEPPRCSSAAANETTRISERYRSLTGIIGVLGAFPIRFARLLGLLAIVLADLLPGLGVVFRSFRCLFAVVLGQISAILREIARSLPTVRCVLGVLQLVAIPLAPFLPRPALSLHDFLVFLVVFLFSLASGFPL